MFELNFEREVAVRVDARGKGFGNNVWIFDWMELERGFIGRFWVVATGKTVVVNGVLLGTIWVELARGARGEGIGRLVTYGLLEVSLNNVNPPTVTGWMLLFWLVFV